MPHVIAWCGFLGAWLLVAGPLDQAVRELEGQGFERQSVARAAEQVGERPRTSSWWMLVPPVWYVLHRWRDRGYRHAVGKAMEDEELAAFFKYRDVAGAWTYVAAGASLIAVEETWGLREAYGWPEGIWVAIVFFMLVLCGATAKVRRHRRERRGIAGAAGG